MLMQVLQVRNYVENRDMNETAGFVYDKSYIGFCQYKVYRYDRCWYAAVLCLKKLYWC